MCGRSECGVHGLGQAVVGCAESSTSGTEGFWGRLYFAKSAAVLRKVLSFHPNTRDIMFCDKSEFSVTTVGVAVLVSRATPHCSLEIEPSFEPLVDQPKVDSIELN